MQACPFRLSHTCMLHLRRSHSRYFCTAQEAHQNHSILPARSHAVPNMQACREKDSAITPWKTVLLLTNRLQLVISVRVCPWWGSFCPRRWHSSPGGLHRSCADAHRCCGVQRRRGDHDGLAPAYLELQVMQQDAVQLGLRLVGASTCLHHTWRGSERSRMPALPASGQGSSPEHCRPPEDSIRRAGKRADP